MNDREPLIKGFVGAVGGFGSVAVSSVLHAWLSVLVLLAGFCVSVVTIWSIWKGGRRRNRDVARGGAAVRRLCAGHASAAVSFAAEDQAGELSLVESFVGAKRSEASAVENNQKAKG